ncbi:MAG: cytochrome c [Bacteroidota bacterium]
MTQEKNHRDETDFREIARDPRKLFAYSYIYILLILLGLGAHYVGNLSVVGKNAIIPVVLRDSSAFVRDIPLQRPRILPPVDVVKAGRPTDTLLARGEELYSANCSTCHGNEGVGDGPAGLSLNPVPRNFQSPEGWTHGQKVSEIYRTLEEGITKNGMASYNYLPPEDRFALAHYVRTFLPAAPEDSPEELQGLEVTYQLSRGTSIPGQISIKKAAQRIIREQQETVDRVHAIAAAIDARGSQDEGAMVFEREVLDGTRVITCFEAGTGETADLTAFVRTVSADPSANGFRASVVSLSDREWDLLFQFISELK